jgi:hypothetical protein
VEDESRAREERYGLEETLRLRMSLRWNIHSHTHGRGRVGTTIGYYVENVEGSEAQDEVDDEEETGGGGRRRRSGRGT